MRELRLPEGGFASAQDADTDGVEGLTYSWTPEEVADVLGEAHPEWLQPFEHDRSIAACRRSCGGHGSGCSRRVLERPQPVRDDKVLDRAGTGWRSAAFAEAARAARPCRLPRGGASTWPGSCSAR